MKKTTDIDPVNFAFVMASSTLSITLNILGSDLFSEIFFFLSTLGFALLALLFAMRFTLFTKQMIADLANVEILFKYFTFSAAASSLAIRFCIAGYPTIATVLAIIGAGSTTLMIYATVCRLIFFKKASIEAVSPYWLLMAIACNYVGITITTFWKAALIDNPLFLVLAFCSWACGVTLYLLFMSLNIYRMFFMRFEGKDINPSYWTCVGAAAIAVVDGCNWVAVLHPPLFLEIIKPFVEGVNIFLWGWATAWIPLLCLMIFWKYVRFKVTLEYSPSLWAIVFPLAMYTAATALLIKAIDLPLVGGVVSSMLWTSLIAWGAVAFLALMKLLKEVTTKP